MFGPPDRGRLRDAEDIAGLGVVHAPSLLRERLRRVDALGVDVETDGALEAVDEGLGEVTV